MDLSANDISADALIAMVCALEKNTTLISINLSCNDINADAVMAIAFAVEKNTTLTSINVYNYGFRFDKVTRVLAQSLETNGNLKVLNFSNAYLGSESIIAITCIIEKSHTLTSIDLSKNDLGGDGAIAIASVLEKNTRLTSMDLSKNKIGRTCAIALAQALEKNSTLTSIDLSHNGIGNDGAKAIAKALKANTSLTLINLECCEIGYEGIEALTRALEKNITLTAINLMGNATFKIDEADKAIKQVLQCNRGIRDILERWAIDTEEAVIKGKDLKVLQQTYDQTPSSLSKYYLGVLLEADHTDQSLNKTKSFLKILGGLLPYNLQSLPERFKVNLMEVIERKLLILYRTLTKASLWEPTQEDHLITFLSYTSILCTAHNESCGDLSMLIGHCLQLKGLVSDEDYFEDFDPSLSFSEWLSVMNELEVGNQVKVAMHEILVKTARYQMQHGMDENNVLAAFTDLKSIQEIKQEIKQEIRLGQRTAIQRGMSFVYNHLTQWLSSQQKQNKKTNVDSHGGLEHRHEPSRPKRKGEQGFFMASSKKPCVQEESGPSYQNK